jgi:hypothetical protein
MKYLTSKAWWAAAGTRALKTVVQTGVALLATQAASGQVDAAAIASAALLAGLASLGTSLVGLPELSGQNASA